MTEVHAALAPAEEQIDRILQAMADSFGQQLRSPVPHWPSEQDLSIFAAMTQFPEAFNGVRCLVGPQPVTMKTIVARRLALLGIPAGRIDDLEQRVILQTSIGFARRTPQEWARNVRVPAFLY